jgi:hypothetical protein
MGLRPSPYASVQGSLRAKQMVLGDHKDQANPYHWDWVRENLPGDDDYDPTLPWIAKIRHDGQVASDVHIYVDDCRITASTQELAWLAASRMAKVCSWLGLQDAARKRREPSTAPGAWAGAVIISDETGVYKLVTDVRWQKTQRKIRWFASYLGLTSGEDDEEQQSKERSACPVGHLPHKTAESYRGFLVYVSRTYGAFVPYLKGIHLTLDSWRPFRDDDGWKNTSTAEAKCEVTEQESAPRFVKTVPRLKQDVEVLLDFTSKEKPPKVPVRPTGAAVAMYMFGDASGSGFGISLWVAGEDTIYASHGSWTVETSQKSSNYRELYNLVLKIEELVRDGTIHRGTEIFVFTDNFVAERAFHHGSAKSRLLHELVVRLRKLEMNGDIFIRFIWVAGTRMIWQGTDGLSRGELTAGVMAGAHFLNFVPLNKTAFQRHSILQEWIGGALPGEHWEELSVEGWFTTAQKDGRFIWAPPPATADVAVERLCEARHIRPWCSHIFICPALMTAHWRKTLGKVADAMFTLPVGCPIWPSSMHEPLVVALICPLLSTRPWKVRGSPWMVEFEDKMRGVWSDNLQAQRSHLRKFWMRSWARAGRLC